jgi:hypothetical protein
MPRLISNQDLTTKVPALVFRAGVLAVLVLYCVKTACMIGSTAGADNFTSWVSAKIYNDLFRKFGERRGEKAFTRRLLLASDIKNATGLSGKLRAPETPLARFLRERLSPETVAILESSAGAPGADGLKALLAADLNRVIQTGDLYAKDRFAGVGLYVETKCLLVLRGLASQTDFPDLADQKIEEDASTRFCNVVDANRKLLEDAFPDEISGVLPGGTVFMNAAPHVKLRYYLLAPTAGAFFFGALTGCATLFLRRRRQSPPDVPGPASPAERPAGSKTLPAWLPPALAAMGIFYHGHFWGLVAFVAAGYTPVSPLVRRLSRGLAVLAALYWGVGTELAWSNGWSKIYPGINHFLKMIFGVFNVSF